MLDLLTVNLGAASRKRAEGLLSWLALRPEQVFLLTETSAGAGTSYLLERFRRAGYHVVKTPDVGDRGAALVSRVSVVSELTMDVTVPGRVAAAVLDTEPRILAIAVYVPSRDRSVEKTKRKRDFLASLLAALDGISEQSRGALVLGGDYNVIDRDHRPRYRTFLPFEYEFFERLSARELLDAHLHLSPDDQPHSWVGRTGDGYRYDYFHVDATLADRIMVSAYVHGVREERLTDHSAVSLALDATILSMLHTTRPTEDSEPIETLRLY
ncbi:hypothetical protein DPM19_20700 [Actinomadura craniellae]|uniref:Endonuclease/exonuclease/phosphatase domain-containing protein n=1 Tax=Actinomadura craniellae TaxID=2231787 RepID=A0A365H301_9ACTN|nr:endonuclease/exonuclease/phosphatase family protein [Actinomadura craniellae]RAY13477.1 hypothetical protein DPM19_20700 [Actinomadura craniellae]